MLASPYNCGRTGDALLLAVACCGVGASATTLVVHDEVIASAADDADAAVAAALGLLPLARRRLYRVPTGMSRRVPPRVQ
jgi:hypothetical protein